MLTRRQKKMHKTIQDFKKSLSTGKNFLNRLKYHVEMVSMLVGESHIVEMKIIEIKITRTLIDKIFGYLH